MSMELDSDVALDIWDIFVSSISPKERYVVAEQYINWLMDHGIGEDDLNQVAKHDSSLGQAIRNVNGSDNDEDEEDSGY